MPYLGTFVLEFEKAIAIYEISTFALFQLQNLAKTKNAYIWDQKCFIWVFLIWNIQKTIIIFEISTLEFV